jgi:hypothetical protein
MGKIHCKKQSSKHFARRQNVKQEFFSLDEVHEQDKKDTTGSHWTNQINQFNLCNVIATHCFVNKIII